METDNFFNELFDEWEQNKKCNKKNYPKHDNYWKLNFFFFN